MSKGTSRLVPQHRFWEEDLPLREAPVEGTAKLYDDLLAMDDDSIEISRATNFLRGVGVFFSIIGAPLFLSMASPVYHLTVGEWMNSNFDDFALQVVLLLIFPSSLAMVWFLFRLDARMPRDTPVNFNRRTGKVACYDFTWNSNPFGRWPTTIKEFDWSAVQAEIQKQSGFSGKAYVVRYALVLCICKPGTLEVIDRVTLKGNRMTTQDLKDIWNYLRRYMAEGPANLPQYKPLPQGISFRRSFFEYMRWFDPTAEGREFRKDMPGWLIGINTVISIFILWALIPMGICHYIAMKLAPEPKWPGEA